MDLRAHRRHELRRRLQLVPAAGPTLLEPPRCRTLVECGCVELVEEERRAFGHHGGEAVDRSLQRLDVV